MVIPQTGRCMQRALKNYPIFGKLVDFAYNM